MSRVRLSTVYIHCTHIHNFLPTQSKSIFLSHSLNVGSCNKASRLGRNEDGTFDIIVCPNLIHYLCHLILHLDGQCIDLEGEKG